MHDGPNIARVAGLIGDPARAEMLTALLADRALTATELAGIAGVTKQTASAHLAKLVDAGLLERRDAGSASLLPTRRRATSRSCSRALMGVAFRTGVAAPPARPARAGAAEGARLLRPSRRRARRRRLRRPDRARRARRRGRQPLPHQRRRRLAGGVRHRSGACRAPAPHLLPAVPRLGRASPSSRRRARRRAPRPLLRAALGRSAPRTRASSSSRAAAEQTLRSTFAA